MSKGLELETINKLYLELSQVARAETGREKELRQLAYDAIDFLRVLEEDGEFSHWEEGYNKQVLEELRQDAKKLLI